MKPDEAYRGSLDAADRELIVDEDDVPLGEVLAAVWEAAALLWSNPEDALERCGCAGARRVGATSPLVAAKMFPSIAAALGTPATVLYSLEAPLVGKVPPVQVVCVSPPIIVLGPQALRTAGDGAHDAELRFLLGRAAELARPERVAAAGLPREELMNLVASLARCFAPAAVAAAVPSTIDDVDVRRAHDDLLRGTLPVKLRSRLERLLEDVRVPDLDVDRFVAACERAADRAGLLASGDVAAALLHARAVAGGIELTANAADRAPHVARLALSAGYLAVRGRLGIAVR
jgi:hypothetical protein